MRKVRVTETRLGEVSKRFAFNKLGSTWAIKPANELSFTQEVKINMITWIKEWAEHPTARGNIAAGPVFIK